MFTSKRDIKEAKLIINIFTILVVVLLIIAIFSSVASTSGNIYFGKDDQGTPQGVMLFEDIKTYNLLTKVPTNQFFVVDYFSPVMLGSYIVLFLSYLINFIRIKKHDNIKNIVSVVLIFISSVLLTVLLIVYTNNIKDIFFELADTNYAGSVANVKTGIIPLLSIIFSIIASFLLLLKTYLNKKMVEFSKKRGS